MNIRLRSLAKVVKEEMRYAFGDDWNIFFVSSP